jgi:Amt family ammonium transporter
MVQARRLVIHFSLTGLKSMRSLFDFAGRLALLIALVPMLVGPGTVAAQDNGENSETPAGEAAPEGDGAAAGEGDGEAGEKSDAAGDGEGAEATAAAVEFNGADMAWMMVSCALVLMMTAPGLALFYGGLVRKKNILGVMMQCVFLMGLMSIVWALWGYSFAFGGTNPYIGSLTQHAFLSGVIPYVDDAGAIVVPASGSIPHSLFMMFQGMFFIITPALICGAFAERMKFTTMCVFSVLWGTFVYCPICHWVWATDVGWLYTYGAIDFAGGTVVHISSGVSALVCAMLIGKRIGFNQEPMPPHNLTYTCIGAALLWVGWFGFNAGSAVASNATAVNAFVATHMAAAAGILGWCAAEWLKHGKPGILGACSGAVSGLVCITPAAGAVTPMAGIILGLVAGVVCFWACTTLKNKLGYDDSLDAFGVHGVGGTVGALLAGVFATRAVTGSDGPAGLIEGNAQQMLPQIVGILAAATIAAVGTLILLKVLDAVMGLRVSQDDEVQGLDLSQHGEEGYIFQ